MTTATMCFEYSRGVVRAMRQAELTGEEVRMTQTVGHRAVVCTGRVVRVRASRLRRLVRVDVEVVRTDAYATN